MRIDFPYPGIDSIEVPDQNLLGIFAPSTVEIEKSEEEIIEEALLQPIGSSPLREILEWCQDVLILVDDYTRPTPTQKILPRLIKKLERGGIKREGIRFLIASGTHRPMTEEEILKKFGKEIPKRSCHPYHFLSGRDICQPPRDSRMGISDLRRSRAKSPSGKD